MKPGITTKKNGKAGVKSTPGTQQNKTATTAKSVTTIEAKIDVGYGNNLFVRGEGPGLSWDKGTPLKCVDSTTWQWAAEAGSPLKCKLLLNDSVWMSGEDLVVPPGKRVEVKPAF